MISLSEEKGGGDVMFQRLVHEFNKNPKADLYLRAVGVLRGRVYVPKEYYNPETPYALIWRNPTMQTENVELFKVVPWRKKHVVGTPVTWWEKVGGDYDGDCASLKFLEESDEIKEIAERNEKLYTYKQEIRNENKVRKPLTINCIKVKKFNYEIEIPLNKIPKLILKELPRKQFTKKSQILEYIRVLRGEEVAMNVWSKPYETLKLRFRVEGEATERLFSQDLIGHIGKVQKWLLLRNTEVEKVYNLLQDKYQQIIDMKKQPVRLKKPSEILRASQKMYYDEYLMMLNDNDMYADYMWKLVNKLKEIYIEKLKEVKRL